MPLDINTYLRIGNGGLALISLRLTFLLIASLVMQNTLDERWDCKLLNGINDIILHARNNEISE